MKSDTSMTIRINRDIKQKFDVRLEVPNAVTLAAMEEREQMITDLKARRFDSVESLFTELNAE